MYPDQDEDTEYDDKPSEAFRVQIKAYITLKIQQLQTYMRKSQTWYVGILKDHDTFKIQDYSQVHCSIPQITLGTQMT